MPSQWPFRSQLLLAAAGAGVFAAVYAASRSPRSFAFHAATSASVTTPSAMSWSAYMSTDRLCDAIAVYLRTRENVRSVSCGPMTLR